MDNAEDEQVQWQLSRARTEKIVFSGELGFGLELAR